MKGLLQFFKTTLLGGVLFLLPLVVTVFLLSKAFKLLARALTPVAGVIRMPGVAAFLVANILAVAFLIAACFAAGLIARTRPGQRLGGTAENLVLKKVPGFTLLKSMMRGDEHLGTDTDVSVVLFETEGGYGLGFAVERHPSGLLTVFVPSAPTPAAGTILYLPEEKVKRLDLPVKSAVTTIMQLGVGSGPILDKLSAAGGGK